VYYHFTTVIKGDNKVKTIGTPRKSADKPFLAARVPASLNDALEAHTKSTGESRTDTLINALAAYLGWSEDNVTRSSSSDRLSILEEKIRQLEEAIYKPRQTNLLDIKASQPEQVKTVISFDNEEDKEEVIKTDNKKDNGEVAEEWLNTKEAYERYGTGATYDAFRKTKPEKMLERFGLEADPSRKTSGQYSSAWLRPAR
jgi:hypothetical protein